MLNARTFALDKESRTVLRHSKWDAVLIGLSVAHAIAVLRVPSIPVIAMLLWWNSNTIAHNFIHLPFFRSSALNRGYSMFLTLLLGFPQSLWRDRHLAHHRGHGSIRLTSDIMLELAAVIAMWTVLLARVPAFFLLTYLPAYGLGLALCFIHGYFEHWRAVTSHYGTAYNILFFNDGYHVEHHVRPGEHWSRLPSLAHSGTHKSAWPAVFRWIEQFNLETLERITMRSSLVRNFLLKTHERALRKLLFEVDEIRSVKIVGGGLFPRTAILMREFFPRAHITVVDKSVENLQTAKRFLPDDVILVNDFYDLRIQDDADLVIIPLAFSGDRNRVYANPPARAVLVHDWIWRMRGKSAVVAWCLFKRLNLVRAKQGFQ